MTCSREWVVCLRISVLFTRACWLFWPEFPVRWIASLVLSRVLTYSMAAAQRYLTPHHRTTGIASLFLLALRSPYSAHTFC